MNEIATLGTKVANYTLGMAQFVERIRNAFSFGKHARGQRNNCMTYILSNSIRLSWCSVSFLVQVLQIVFPPWLDAHWNICCHLHKSGNKYYYDIIIPYFANDFQTSRDIFTSHSHHLTTFSIIYLIPYLTHLEWLVVTRWAHDQTSWLVQHKQNNSFMDKGCKS